MLKRALIILFFSVTFSSQLVAGGHKKDIVDTAIAAGNFTTLAAALEAADLIGALKGEGPFTVFAPTDDAFNALPAGTVANLLKPENKETLIKILTYHVLGGAVKSSDVAGKKMDVKMLNGLTASIDGTYGVKINNIATVIAADIEADNGFIHVIDTVIIPD